MAAGLVQAGSRITAALFASVAPLAVIKGADQTITSSTTFANDNALFVSVVANATYLVQLFIDYEGGTQGSSDIKWTFTGPSGWTMRYQGIYRDTSGTVQANCFTGASGPAAGTNGAATLRSVGILGTIVTSSTPGTVQLQWAQNTSSGTGTIVHAQSSMQLWRIS